MNGIIPREPARSGDEQDVVTSWRRVYLWTKRAGATSRTKRAIRRRERHSLKAQIRLEPTAPDE